MEVDDGRTSVTSSTVFDFTLFVTTFFQSCFFFFFFLKGKKRKKVIFYFQTEHQIKDFLLLLLPLTLSKRSKRSPEGSRQAASPRKQMRTCVTSDQSPTVSMRTNTAPSLRTAVWTRASAGVWRFWLSTHNKTTTTTTSDKIKCLIVP